MMNSYCSRIPMLIFLLLMLIGNCHSVKAQNTVKGVISKVTPKGIQLRSGASYPQSTGSYGGTSVHLREVDDNGGWDDLRADDYVALSLDKHGIIVSVTRLGKLTNGLLVHQVTETRPVDGRWGTKKDVTINGRVFDLAGTMDVSENFGTLGHDTVVFDNKENFDTFTAWVGKRNQSRTGMVQFVVLGDGRELFRSPWMSTDDPALQITVPIKGYSGVSLVAYGDKDVHYDDSALWADPIFTKPYLSAIHSFTHHHPKTTKGSNRLQSIVPSPSAAPSLALSGSGRTLSVDAEDSTEKIAHQHTNDLSDRRQILSLYAEHEQATNDSDIKTFMKIYAPTAVYKEKLGEIHSYSDWQRINESIMAQTHSSSYQVQILSLIFRDDTAVANIVENFVETITSNRDGVARTYRNRVGYTDTWIKGESGWQITETAITSWVPQLITK